MVVGPKVFVCGWGADVWVLGTSSMSAYRVRCVRFRPAFLDFSCVATRVNNGSRRRAGRREGAMPKKALTSVSFPGHTRPETIRKGMGHSKWARIGQNGLWET